MSDCKGHLFLKHNESQQLGNIGCFSGNRHSSLEVARLADQDLETASLASQNSSAMQGLGVLRTSDKNMQLNQ